MNPELQEIENLAKVILIGRHPLPERIHESIYTWDLLTEDTKESYRVEARKIIAWGRKYYA